MIGSKYIVFSLVGMFGGTILSAKFKKKKLADNCFVYVIVADIFFFQGFFQSFPRSENVS